MKFIFSLLLMVQFIMAQIMSDGVPYTKLNKINNNLNKIILDTVPLETLLDEDRNREPGTPFRYGLIHKTEFNPNNSGNWMDLEDGARIWQIHFKSNDAYAINIEYENFFIPQGGELYVYNPGYEMIYGSYTHLNNGNDGFFSTPHIQGDDIINLKKL